MKPLEATPGSEYIHIGSDETYELAACDECKAKAQEIGKSGVYHLFVKKAAEHLAENGQKSDGLGTTNGMGKK